ncbi:hypothetical protein EI94DRAFT_1802066 [Lactarius quietus]|nr:hypothetical protein EI94DRAFT_1802066 [Lactarius quietus]
MGIATTYAQIPLLSELSGIPSMSGGQGYYFDNAAGQPSTYASAWQPSPAPDPWGLPPSVDPQNYSGGGMPPAIPVYPAGAVSFAAPIAVPGYPPPGAPLAAPFDARNYVPPESSSAPPFDARNYIPPDGQQQTTNTYSTYEPRTSESAFSATMQLHGGGLSPPSYHPHPTSCHLSRSISARPTPTEREARLYDRPGNWRPRFQMPRSGVSSLLPNLNRGKSFPPDAYSTALTVDTTSRTLDDRIRFSALREPPVLWDLRDDSSRVLFRELKRPVTGFDFTRFTTEPPTPYMKLYHSRLPWYIEVKTTNGVGVTFHDLFSHIQREEREKISRAWKERCQYNQGAMNQGVKKVDYLMRDCVFMDSLADVMGCGR